MAKETTPQSKIDYDKEKDILFIYGPRKASSSIKYASFIIDVDKNEKVTSVEILEASKMLKNLGVTKEMLTNAQSGRLTSREDNRGFLYIFYEIVFSVDDKQQAIKSGPIAVPASVYA